MNYYEVHQTGTGTEMDPYRPDLPNGINYVGNTDGTTFLIATQNKLPDGINNVKLLSVEELEDICNARSINFNNIINEWQIKT